MNSENIINIEFEDKIIITFIPSDQEFANKPDIIRLVDCNRRPPEPKYKNDENILGNFVTEYRQIDTGTGITRGSCKSGIKMLKERNGIKSNFREMSKIVFFFNKN